MIWRNKLALWNALIVGGAFLLLLGIHTTWWSSEQANSPAHVVKGPKVPTVPILRDQQLLSTFALVARKNLFSPGRRGPDQGQANQQNNLEGHQLLGTIIIGDTRAALIGSKALPQDKAAAEIDVVYMGDQWNGMKVKDINNESVIFLGKDGPKTLTFPEE